ncbi:MAG TPA: DNA repair protein RecO [Blastocatellia bacterium]|nr:DNA repair protein RecO [Blastocatellia bacterium]
MPLHETDAFVLRTFTIKEADKVCVFFTREAGKLRGVAHGARRLKSRFGASLEPFTEVSLVYFQKENKELVSISNCEIINSQFVEGLSSETLGVIHYLAELVIEFVPDHEPNEKIYRLIGATLDSLRRVGGSIPAGPVGPGAAKGRDEKLSAIVRYFEIWMLKLAGFFPHWKNCGACEKNLAGEAAVWLTNEGVPQCSACGGGRGEELKPLVWRTIHEVLTQPPTTFLAPERDARSIAQIGNLAARLIDRVLERELKSYEVLDRLRPVEYIQQTRYKELLTTNE